MDTVFWLLGGVVAGAIFGVVSMWLDSMDGEVYWLGIGDLLHSKVVTWGLLGTVVVTFAYALGFVPLVAVFASFLSLVAQAFAALLTYYALPLLGVVLP